MIANHLIGQYMNSRGAPGNYKELQEAPGLGVCPYRTHQGDALSSCIENCLGKFPFISLASNVAIITVSIIRMTPHNLESASDTITHRCLMPKIKTPAKLLEHTAKNLAIIIAQLMLWKPAALRVLK